MLLALFAACHSPNEAPAPPTLDEYLHQSWSLYAAEDLAGIGTATEAIHATFDPEEFPLQGTYSDLTEEEFVMVDVTSGADPADATGFYLVGTLDCSSAELLDALTNPHQDEVFPGNYDAYQRDFTSDIDTFLAGDADIVTWDTTYTLTIPLGGQYTTSVHGGALRIVVNGEEGFATRTWAPEPAEADGEGLALDQDYQIEVYYPGDGGMIHAYGMWRQFNLNADTDQDNDTIQAIILDSMNGYFDDTSTYCATLR